MINFSESALDLIPLNDHFFDHQELLHFMEKIRLEKNRLAFSLRYFHKNASQSPSLKHFRLIEMLNGAFASQFRLLHR